MRRAAALLVACAPRARVPLSPPAWRGVHATAAAAAKAPAAPAGKKKKGVPCACISAQTTRAPAHTPTRMCVQPAIGLTWHTPLRAAAPHAAQTTAARRRRRGAWTPPSRKA
jgi:hypothetical protein